jgi:hypothetical protein
MSVDLLRARVAFRDRSLSDVLDLALRFMVVQGRAYATVALGSLLPLFAFALLAGWKLGWAASWLVAIPLSSIAEIPFTVLASRLVFQERVSTGEVLRLALRDGPRVLVLRVIGATATLFGLLMFIIPGIWTATIFVFVGEVLLLERASLGQSIGRSQRIASSALSEVILGAMVVVLLPVGSIFLADIAGRSIVGELLQFRPPAAVWTTGGGVLATLGLFLQVPYLATARFFLYLNVRTRAEGWDIQTRFAAIAARAQEDDTRKELA